MRVGIATDHGGFELKDELVRQLRAAGHEPVDPMRLRATVNRVLDSSSRGDVKPTMTAAL